MDAPGPSAAPWPAKPASAGAPSATPAAGRSTERGGAAAPAPPPPALRPPLPDDDAPRHHEGSFRKYMRTKIDGLSRQFDAAAAAARRSCLFAGVAIYVDGLTAPPAAELKALMAAHGGRYENYLRPGAVTHVVASELPDGKVAKALRARAGGPAIVRPEWLVASLRAGRRLPEKDFQLAALRAAPRQRALAPFAARPSPGALALAPEELFAPPPTAAAPAAAPPPPPADSPPPPAGAPARYDPARVAAAQAAAAAMRAACDVLQMRPRSTADDPHFTETYFRASRLHFIGTWKARLEALLASPAATSARAPAPHAPGVPRAILHVDLDAFFATSAAAGRPEFAGLPLAVCHSASARGSAEVSSANYAARAAGVRAGRTVGEALARCPDLIIVPYEYDRYEAASEAAYRVFLSFTPAVAPLSCDEAYLDVTGLGDPEEIAAAVRRKVFEATGVTASAGIAESMLLARVATGRAKPNGQLRVPGGAAAAAFLAPLPADSLPGVGWATARRLAALGAETVAQLQALRGGRAALQAALGARAGALLFDYARGVDARRVEPPGARRSLGAEVNWGVRFDQPEEPVEFVATLAREVATRLVAAGVRGRTVTLKLMRARPGAGAPARFLGHGVCDSLSRSATLARAVGAAEELAAEGVALLRALRVPHAEIRGVGLAVSRLVADGGGEAAGGGGGGGGGARPLEALWRGAEARREAAQPAAVADGGDVAEKELPPTQEQPPQAESGLTGWESDSQTRAPAAAPAARAPAPPPPDEEDGADAEGGGLTGAARAALLARFAGRALDEVDAEEWAGLSWAAQRELAAHLPRARGGAPPAAAAAAAGSSTVAAPAPRPPPADPPALPALGDVDPDVLAALPLELRVEIEAAYGLRRPPRRAAAGRGGGGGGGGRGGGGGGAARRSRAAAPPPPLNKRARLDAFVANPPPLGAAPRRAAAPPERALTPSQVDADVLRALPPELRREVEAQLAAGAAASAAAAARAPGRSRLAQGAAPAAAGASLEALREAQLRAEAPASPPSSEDGAATGGDEAAAALPRPVADFLAAADAAAGLAAGLPALEAALEALRAEAEAEWEPSAALHAGAAALAHWLRAAAPRLGAADLGAARAALRRLAAAGAAHPWFEGAAAAGARAAQRAVRRRYGAPVSLRRAL